MSIECEIKTELQKSAVVRTWGRDVILAIDFDNPTKLIEIFRLLHFGEANVNERASHWNYAGYAWTPLMHEYWGEDMHV